MQSPLTPQRGRIESNPREYTHMGPRLCGELKTMPADWAKAPRVPPNERGFSDEIIRRRPKCRPIIHSRIPFVSNREMRDRRETYTKDGCTAKSQTINSAVNSAVWLVIVFSVKTFTNKASCKRLPPYFVRIFMARNCRHMIGRVSTIAI